MKDIISNPNKLSEWPSLMLYSVLKDPGLSPIIKNIDISNNSFTNNADTSNISKIIVQNSIYSSDTL